jgi:hypothetical protein
MTTKRDDGFPATVTWNGKDYETPEFEEIERWVYDSVVEALDGCSIEPDGHCEHNSPSWLLALGLL